MIKKVSILQKIINVLWLSKPFITTTKNKSAISCFFYVNTKSRGLLSFHLVPKKTEEKVIELLEKLLNSYKDDDNYFVKHTFNFGKHISHNYKVQLLDKNRKGIVGENTMGIITSNELLADFIGSLKRTVKRNEKEILEIIDNLKKKPKASKR